MPKTDINLCDCREMSKTGPTKVHSRITFGKCLHLIFLIRYDNISKYGSRDPQSTRIDAYEPEYRKVSMTHVVSILAID